MSYRHKCIAVVAFGVTSLVLGSWFLGNHAPNALLLVLGALLLALVTTQGMFVALLVISTRSERAGAEERPR